MLATGGGFNVSVSDPEALKRLVERERDRDRGVTLSTLGIGDYNDRLMETLADAGEGNASVIDGDAEIAKVLDRELGGTLQIVAKDVKAQVEFNSAAVRSYRQIGYENRQVAERDFDDDRIDAGDIGASHQVTAPYEITPVAEGVTSRCRYAANRTASRDRARGAARSPIREGPLQVAVERPVQDAPARSLGRPPRPRGRAGGRHRLRSRGRRLGPTAQE